MKKHKVSTCVLHSLCVVLGTRGHLFKEGQVAAALSEAQQQRQDVDGAGGLLGLLGARHSRVGLGQTKFLSHCRRDKHKLMTKAVS